MAERDYEILDPRFDECVRTTEQVQQLYDGCRWAEGPAYFPAHRGLIFSDVSADRLLRYDETSDLVGVLRAPSHYANGNTVDAEGRLISCQQGTRSVVRTEHDGSLTVLADRYAGKRLNSPNDVAVHPSGSVYFTDPTYGIDSDYEGYRAESEIGGCHVYRVDPRSGECAVVSEDFAQPNGIAFAEGGRRLYVSDTGATHAPDGPRDIRAFAVAQEGSLSGGEVLATCTAGIFDGFRLDESGRIWTSADDGVHCLLPDGTLIGKVLVPETVANVCFGGSRRTRLYICATTSLYAVHVKVRGAPPLGGAPSFVGAAAGEAQER